MFIHARCFGCSGTNIPGRVESASVANPAPHANVYHANHADNVDDINYSEDKRLYKFLLTSRSVLSWPMLAVRPVVSSGRPTFSKP